MKRNTIATVLVTIALLIGSTSVVVRAEPVQRARIDRGALKARTKMIRRARHQGFKPQARAEMVQRLATMDPAAKAFRQEISQAPMKVRYEVFKAMAEAQGHAPSTFTRRIKGKQKVNGKTKATSSSKTVVEVSEATFDLFKQVMGPNVVWFAANASPGHLHTLIGDQGDNGAFHHNTYGTSTDQNARVTGSFSQYAFPVALTDKEMDRFAQYLNAGTNNSSNKGSVFGFYAGKTKITDMACTNWATAAPIGKLPRWARTIDKRVATLANAGSIANGSALKGGLHKALVKATTPEARAEIVGRVLAVNGLTKWNRSAVQRMLKEFNKEAGEFANRPAACIMRGSLAAELGLGRSRDPAKWTYDLLLSKATPIIAVLNGTPNADFANMTFNMEVMGNVGPDGNVTGGHGAVQGNQ